MTTVSISAVCEPFRTELYVQGIRLLSFHALQTHEIKPIRSVIDSDAIDPTSVTIHNDVRTTRSYRLPCTREAGLTCPHSRDLCSYSSWCLITIYRQILQNTLQVYSTLTWSIGNCLSLFLITIFNSS